MLPCLYPSHTFVLAASLTTQAILEIEKRRSDSSCAIFHNICLFCSAIWSVQPLITSCLDNCNRFHTGLASELAPFISKYTFIWSDKRLPVYAFMLFPSTFLEYLTFTSSSVCISPVLSLPLFLEYTLSVLSGYLCTFLGFLKLNRSSLSWVCVKEGASGRKLLGHSLLVTLIRHRS